MDECLNALDKARFLTLYLSLKNGLNKLYSKLVHEKTHAPNRVIYEVPARCAR